MNSTRQTYLPLSESPVTPEHKSLLQEYQRASWIWTPEVGPYVAPYAPTGEQRGFRWTYVNTVPTRTPSKATIIMAVDNYFALYINGAVVHPADPDNDLWTAQALTVPIQPSIDKSIGDEKVVFSVRAVNARDTPHVMQNPAGIVAAIKISFDGSKDSETFITGPNMRWKGEALLEPGWVEVDFDDSNWQDAVVFSPQLANAIWDPHRRRGPTKVLVGASLPRPSTILPVPITPSVPVHIGGPRWSDWTITLGLKELAGILIGLVFVAFVFA